MPNTMVLQGSAAARGKPGLVGVGGVLSNYKGDVLFMISKHVGIKDLCIARLSKISVESDS